LHLPAIYQWPEITGEGGLIGYGPHLTRTYGEILSRQLAELLRGTKPAGIPVERPTKFDLAINIEGSPTLQLGWHNPDQSLPLLSALGQCHEVTSWIAD
jgi:putative tryptophan/tyrosine transport system substrate-binding protein